MAELDGMVCVVTGASGTIGRAVCMALARQGAEVFGVYGSRPEPVTSISEECSPAAGRITPMKCNLRDPEQISATVSSVLERTGRIDVLICSAGETLRKSSLLTGNSDAEHLFSLNFHGVTQLCRQVLRPMMRQSYGRVILLGSRAGEHGLPGQSVYSASKAALHAYAKSLAFEVGSKGITVNAVAPGAVASGEQRTYTQQDEARVCESIGLRRLGKAEEIAAVIAFLAAPAASYVSGAVIPVDGAGRF